MNNDLAILFIYHENNIITQTNYNSIVNSARGYPVYKISVDDFKKDYHEFLDSRPIRYWSPKDIWLWGSDNIFIYWYLANPTKRARNYLILEWDTYANDINLIDFFGEDNLFNNQGIKAVKVREFGADNWNWFDSQQDNPIIAKYYQYKNFTGCTPLCGTLISNNCIEDIIEHLKSNVFANKIYVETKFATIAKFLGYPVEQYKGSSAQEYIAYDFESIVGILEHKIKHEEDTCGIYHPIKSLDIWQKYFKYKHYILNKNKSKYICNIDEYKPPVNYYGIANNVKNTLIKLAEFDTKINIESSVLGDPICGKGKNLYIEYVIDGNVYKAIIPENAILEINSVLNSGDYINPI
jgi:hypothetical protein